MPLTLEDHQERTRTLRVHFKDYTTDPSKYLDVTYRPRGFEELQRRHEANERAWKRRDREIDAIPDELDREDARAATNEERDHAFARILLPIIAGWDLFYDRDQTNPVPVTEDSLIAIGASSMLELILAIMEDMKPSPNGLSASGEPSSPGAPAPTALQPVT
jgi:hypothetical protein